MMVEFSQEIADTICREIAEGRSLRAICAADGMPDKASVFRWLDAHETFRDQYARAREQQAEHYAEELIEIVDSENDPARARVRMDARKWAASKLAPKKYGDKVEQTVKGDPDAPLRIERIERVIVDPLHSDA